MLRIPLFRNSAFRTIALLIVVLLTGAWTGCNPEPAPVEQTAQVMQFSNLEGGRIVREQPVKGEIFKLRASFSTDMNADQWHVTTGKTMRMEAQTSGLPEGYEVMIDNVHIDVLLNAGTAMLNGIKIDSMDDRLHTGTQIGFPISDSTIYENTFGIEGYSETLINGWGYFNSSWGYTTLDETRLTEANLIKRGANGTKFMIVWDLLVKAPGESSFRTRSLVDVFIIPIAK